MIYRLEWKELAICGDQGDQGKSAFLFLADNRHLTITFLVVCCICSLLVNSLGLVGVDSESSRDIVVADAVGFS